MSLTRADLDSALADAIKMQIAHLADTLGYALTGGPESQEYVHAPERFERGLRNILTVHKIASATFDKVMPAPESPAPPMTNCEGCGVAYGFAHEDDCPRICRSGAKP